MDTIEQNKTADRQSWPIKILLFIGSLFIAALVLSFFIIESVDSIAAILFSLMALSGAVIHTVKSDNDTGAMLIALPLFITGYVLMFLSGWDESLLLFIQLLISAVSFYFSKSYSIGQILLLYSLALLPAIFFSFDGPFHSRHFHIYSFVIILIYMVLYAATIKPWLFSIDIIARHIRTFKFSTALISAVLVFWALPLYSIVFAAASYAISVVLLKKYVKGRNLIIGCVLALLCCASTAAYPVMALAFLGMLLAFAMLDYVGLVIFSATLIVGISKFYYDLNMSLVNKSYMLLASGALFLLLFYCIKRLQNE
ncbi:MAG: DUF4401 domain-containing protein [Salinivirgaceae bacterium]|nr:DUF4401 domain-containing protein [Salinivirgaceae bacterium]